LLPIAKLHLIDLRVLSRFKSPADTMPPGKFILTRWVISVSSEQLSVINSFFYLA
jgi:hypothetical protein